MAGHTGLQNSDDPGSQPADSLLGCLPTRPWPVLGGTVKLTLMLKSYLLVKRSESSRIYKMYSEWMIT